MPSAAARKKHFTVDEANQRLPLVRAIVGDIVDLFKDVHERRERLQQMRLITGGSEPEDDDVYGEEVRQVETEIGRDVERLQAFVEELHGLGVELKDPVTGLVDFRTMIDGREAYLCWRLGEDEVEWWHELETGVAGRQSLLEGAFAGDPAGDDLRFDADD